MTSSPSFFEGSAQVAPGLAECGQDSLSLDANLVEVKAVARQEWRRAEWQTGKPS